MRCPLCNRIIGDTYDGVQMHFYHHHPERRLGPRPPIYDEAQKFRYDVAHDIETRRMRKKNRRHSREVEVS